jgi:hypothetical protein
MFPPRRLAPLLLLCWLGGCQREAVEFNNRVAATQADVGRAVEDFGRVLQPMVERGATLSPAEIEEAYRRLQREFEKVRAAASNLQPPQSLAGADELRRAQQAFLDFQERLLKEDLAEVVQIASEGAPTADALYRRLLNKFQAIKEKEQEQVAALQEAQKKFAAANGVRLGPKE